MASVQAIVVQQGCNIEERGPLGICDVSGEPQPGIRDGGVRTGHISPGSSPGRAPEPLSCDNNTITDIARKVVAVLLTHGAHTQNSYKTELLKNEITTAFNGASTCSFTTVMVCPEMLLVNLP